MAALGARPSLVAIAVGNHPASKYILQADENYLLRLDINMTKVLMQDIFDEKSGGSRTVWG